MEYRVHTLNERPDLSGALRELNRKSWPDFIISGDTFSWDRLYAELSDFLLVLTDENERVIGGGLTVPAEWNGRPEDLPPSIEKIIVNGLEGSASSANTLIPVAGVVDKDFRGEGISTAILKEIKHLAVRRGFQNLIIPVRPTWKARYPLQDIESYSTWRNTDGSFYDPWLRTHQRLGATILKCVDCTLKIEGTIRDWENWTGMVFPESGEYVVKDALQPVKMDVASDRGVYREPNVWMRHPLP
jgi:GNAT superfamily N-acetyltransferase